MIWNSREMFEEKEMKVEIYSKDIKKRLILISLVLLYKIFKNAFIDLKILF